MIKGSAVHLKNDKLEEIVVGLKPDFPYSSIYASLHEYVGGIADWHWHSEFELFFVIEGNVSYHLENGVYDFTEGEGGLINSNVLHMTSPTIPGEPAVTSVQIMDKRFIAGNSGSLIETKYIQPIIRSSGLEIIPFNSVDERHKGILHELKLAYECEQAQAYGYEFEIRNHLSNAWILLAEDTRDKWSDSSAKTSLDSVRIKDMLSYINAHFAEKVTLGQIAKAADISDREALRCFQRSVKMTPFEYLAGRRIQEAADMLAGTNEQIIMIGELCGFSSGSYFGKVFKERMGCSPKEFRKRLGNG